MDISVHPNKYIDFSFNFPALLRLIDHCQHTEGGKQHYLALSSVLGDLSVRGVLAHRIRLKKQSCCLRVCVPKRMDGSARDYVGEGHLCHCICHTQIYRHAYTHHRQGQHNARHRSHLQDPKKKKLIARHPCRQLTTTAPKPCFVRQTGENNV